MPTLRLLAFSGEVPRLLPRLLGDQFAQDAYNTRLDDGGLTPVRENRLEHWFIGEGYPENIGTIFKHKGEWLAFEGRVKAVPGPVADDRLYIFGNGAPRIRVNGNEMPLAIQRPEDALTASVSGTPTYNLVNTRMYVYTLVTDLGEETEPSPVSNSVDWEHGQTVTLTGFVDEAPGRTITHQRIYRSSTGTSGGTDFYLIAERPATDADFVDDIAPEAFMERLPSRTWNAPPDELEGVIALPGGMMAGFIGKDLYFCEPYRPHAWPENYVLTMDYDIVGLGAYENTIVVMTDGQPYLVTGSAPETMRPHKLELNLPCINPMGIQDLGYTVVYPSHDGLVTVSGGSAQVTTTNLLTRDDWQELHPTNMVSGQFNGRYFSSYNYVTEAGDTRTGTLIFDFTGQQPFIIRSDASPDAFYYDMPEGKLYLLIDRAVYEYDAPDQIKTMQYWKSKEFVLPKPTNFGAILIEVGGLSYEEVQAINRKRQEMIDENESMMGMPSIGGEVNGSALNGYPVNGDMLKQLSDLRENGTVSVQIYADGKLVASVDKFNRMARLPSGFLARRWEISVSSDVPISQISLATTGAELMEV